MGQTKIVLSIFVKQNKQKTNKTNQTKSTPKPPHGGSWKQYGSHKTRKDCMNRDLICTYFNVLTGYEFNDHSLKLWKRVEAFWARNNSEKVFSLFFFSFSTFKWPDILMERSVVRISSLSHSSISWKRALFLLTQSPSPNEPSGIWRSVWQPASCIPPVTKLLQNKLSCHQYWGCSRHRSLQFTVQRLHLPYS